MEKKNNKIIIILMGVIIVILAVLCVLFATDMITFNIKENSNSILESNNDNNNNNIINEVEEMTNEEAIKLLNDYGKRIFNYVHSLSVYCGDNMRWNNDDDFIPDENLDYLHLYDVSQDFKNKSELKAFLKKYFSDDIIEKYNRNGNYIYETYKEKDNKLYCLNSNKDCGMSYNDNGTSYVIDSLLNNKIIANATIYYNTCGEENTFVTSKIILEKIGDNWIITQYDENK